MKKFFLIICFLFFVPGAKALTPNLEYYDNIYSNRVGDNNKIWSGKIAIINIDGEAAYCLDPYLLIGTGYEINQNYKISDSDLEYFELVSYFGYNKTTRNNIYYYMATQELIWERIIGNGNVFWTTEQYNNGVKIDISSYKNEIINEINNFNKLPEFGSNSFSIDAFNTLDLFDSNGVIKYYTVKSLNGSKLLVNNDILSITKNNELNDNIVLTRNLYKNYKTTIYSSSNNQTLGKFGINRFKEKVINVSLRNYKTTLFINFFDSETKEKIDDIDFEICNLKKPYKLENGYKFTDIYEGTYEFCKIEEPYDMTDLNFLIDKSNFKEETYIDIYLNKKINISSESSDIDDKNIKDDNMSAEENNEEEYKKIIEEENNTVEKLINGIDNINIQYENIIDDTLSELPNTYDYEFPIYSILLSIVIGGIFYKII